jgi:predicted dithiol-disulfide oxidoreductase (DUF899 family)
LDRKLSPVKCNNCCKEACCTKEKDLIITDLFIESEYFHQVMAGDGLPSKICRQCIRQLDRWYAFKQKCENSDAVLRQFALKPKPELVCVKVRITAKLLFIANNYYKAFSKF